MLHPYFLSILIIQLIIPSTTKQVIRFHFFNYTGFIIKCMESFAWITFWHGCSNIRCRTEVLLSSEYVLAKKDLVRAHAEQVSWAIFTKISKCSYHNECFVYKTKTAEVQCFDVTADFLVLSRNRNFMTPLPLAYVITDKHNSLPGYL